MLEVDFFTILKVFYLTNQPARLKKASHIPHDLCQALEDHRQATRDCQAI